MSDSTAPDPPIVAPGVWLQTHSARDGAPGPCLFLDRDGVIVEERHFLSRPADVRLLPGAARLIRGANRAGVAVAVVTNQSGIDRGYYGWTEFAAVERTIAALLGAEDAALDAVAACPFHPDFTPGYDGGHDRWRKPGPAMLTAVAERLNLDLARSWLVGDRAIDVEAARNAGLAGAIHVRSGHGAGEREAALALVADGFPVLVAEGLDDGLAVLGSRIPGMAGS